MKKKILTFILSICLIMPGMFCLTACGTPENEEKETITNIVVLDQINLNKVYDGKPVEDPFIYSIIGEQKFEYSVAWYQGDTKLDENPINAGNYKLSITINYGEKTEILKKEFKIEKCIVDKPKAPELLYNGEMQYPFENIDDDIIEVSGTIGSDGYYYLQNDSALKTEFCLRDKANYIWNDGTNSDFTVNWSWIKKACDALIEVEKAYDGTSTTYVKLTTTEHGLAAKDANKGLYLVVNFTSGEVGATVKDFYVALKRGDNYDKLQGFSFDEDGLPINIEYNQFMARCYHNYYFSFRVNGKIV